MVQLEHNDNDIKFAHKVYRLSAGIQKVKYLLRTVDKVTLISWLRVCLSVCLYKLTRNSNTLLCLTNTL